MARAYIARRPLRRVRGTLKADADAAKKKLKRDLAEKAARGEALASRTVLKSAGLGARGAADACSDACGLILVVAAPRPVPQVLVDPKLVAGRNRLQEELRAMLSRVDANAAAKVAARAARPPRRSESAPRTPGPRAASTFGTAKSGGAGGRAHALREIEKLRREQNAALLAAIDAEQKRELQRERELEVAGASVTATADREQHDQGACHCAAARRMPPPTASPLSSFGNCHFTMYVSHLSSHHRLSPSIGPDILLERSKADAAPDGTHRRARARAGEQDGEARHDALSAGRKANCIRQCNYDGDPRACVCLNDL